MTKFEVTIIRKIVTVIKVEAARETVAAYGCIEATNDFYLISEDVQTRLAKVAPCTTP